MRVISQKPFRDFAKRHAAADGPLRAWHKLVKNGRFRNLSELKRTFRGVDLVPVRGRDFYLFNVGGNQYRLIAAIHFNTQILFVRPVLTHTEYDTDNWKRKP